MPLGVLLFNEKKLDEMCKILECLQKYVPSDPVTHQAVLPNGDAYTHQDYKFHPILLGGDQLSVARVRGGQGIRSNHENAKDCLKGFIPVIEDWHACQTLMQVIVIKLAMHKCSSIFCTVNLGPPFQEVRVDGQRYNVPI